MTVQARSQGKCHPSASVACINPWRSHRSFRTVTIYGAGIVVEAAALAYLYISHQFITHAIYCTYRPLSLREPSIPSIKHQWLCYRGLTAQL